MFNSYQTQLIQEEMYKKYSKSNKIKNKSLFQRVFGTVFNYLKQFLQASSIHGLGHLVAPNRYFLERVFWFKVVTLSVFGSVYLSRTTWLRYQYSPTVVSMDRDMFAWNTTFPSVTMCLDQKIDPKKMSSYLRTSKAEDKDKLKEFIHALSNVSYGTFDTLPVYDELPAESYMETLLNLSISFAPTLTIGASGISLEVVPTITEMGLCYAINSQVAVYNSPSYRDANRWDVISSQNDTFFIHPLDGEVFAQVLAIPSSYDVYLHGPLEVPDISAKRQHSATNYYMKSYVTALSVYTTEEAAKLKVPQRRCRFPIENNLKHNAIYSYTMCRMECRIKYCLKFCQCIPHFYRKIGDEKICDVKGLQCLALYQEDLYNLREGAVGQKYECDCLPLCDDVNYVMQSNSLQEWFLGTNLQWGVITYPRMRYKRDIIFGFTDVLVAVGSMAGLFLGCSVLSFMEIIYFLTLRLFWYIYSGNK